MSYDQTVVWSWISCRKFVCSSCQICGKGESPFVLKQFNQSETRSQIHIGQYRINNTLGEKILAEFRSFGVQIENGAVALSSQGREKLFPQQGHPHVDEWVLQPDRGGQGVRPVHQRYEVAHVFETKILKAKLLNFTYTRNITGNYNRTNNNNKWQKGNNKKDKINLE